MEEGKLKSRPIQMLLNELEEDAYLLSAMEDFKNEKAVSKADAIEFESWLKSSVEKHNKSVL